MEYQQLAGQFKLDIKILSDDRSREVVSKPRVGPHAEQVKHMVIWTRKCSLTERVYVEESPYGELRVVKRVPWRDKSVANWRSEMDVMERVSKTTEAQKKLFVDFIGWFPTKEHVCFVMEYCSLGDISQCYPDPLSEVETRSMCEQLLEALAVLHESGITHRDVKPQNVLVVQKTPIMVKLADFGISKLTREGDTELRTRVGTDGYMAPEVFGLLDDMRESSSYTSAVDMWSLGSLLYYALTKSTPFCTFSSLQSYAQGKAPFPETPLVEKNISIGGRAFLERLLWPLPDARPKASKKLIASWTIHPNARSGSVAAQSARAPAASTRPQSASPEKVPFEPEMAPSSSVVVGLPAHEHVMDFYSIELWHMIQRTYSLVTAIARRLTGRSDHQDGVLSLFVERAARDTATRYIRSDILQIPSADRLQAFLEAGANPNILHNGHTVLHLAVEKGYIEWLEVLLQYGADMKMRTERERLTALHLAAKKIHTGQEYLGSKLVQFLLDQGADPDLPNEQGRTLLHELIRAAVDTAPAYSASDWIPLVKRLLKQGASTEGKTFRGLTPLSYAIGLGAESIATLLLEGGARPDTQDRLGRTPLHIAIEFEKVSIDFMKRLIDAGAPIDQEDIYKHTPLFEAANDMRPEIMGLLLDSGAKCEFDDPEVMKRIRFLMRWRKLKKKLSFR